MRLAGLGIVLVGALTYFNALGNPALMDDVDLFADNALHRDRAGLVRLLTQRGETSGPMFSNHYRPVLGATYWINYQLFGRSMIAYRAVNVALHLANALLLGLLVQRLVRRVKPQATPRRLRLLGLTAAALFATHPIFSIVINQAGKRGACLVALFTILALLLLDGSTSQERLPAARLARLALALVCGALAQLSKEDAVVLPALVALYGLRTGLWVGRWRAGAATVAAFAVVPLVYALAWPPFVPGGTGPRDVLRYFLAQPSAQLEYLSMLLLPSRVVAVSGLAPAPWPPTVAGVTGVAALTGVLILGVVAWRRAPLGSLAVLWGAVVMAPTSVFPLVLVADPVRVYLGYLGVIAVASEGVTLLGERLGDRVARGAAIAGWLRAVPALLACLWCCIGTLQTNDSQSDGVTAYQRSIALHPDGKLPNALLCTFLARAHDPGALAQCVRAEALAPQDPSVALCLIGIHARRRELARAERVLSSARARMGPRWELTLGEAQLAWAQMQLVRAERAFGAVLRVAPDHSEARAFLADVRLHLGLPGAEQLIAPLVRHPPADPETRRMLAVVRAALAAGARPR